MNIEITELQDVANALNLDHKELTTFQHTTMLKWIHKNIQSGIKKYAETDDKFCTWFDKIWLKRDETLLRHLHKIDDTYVYQLTDGAGLKIEDIWEWYKHEHSISLPDAITAVPINILDALSRKKKNRNINHASDAAYSMTHRTFSI